MVEVDYHSLFCMMALTLTVTLEGQRQRREHHRPGSDGLVQEPKQRLDSRVHFGLVARSAGLQRLQPETTVPFVPTAVSLSGADPLSSTAAVICDTQRRTTADASRTVSEAVEDPIRRVRRRRRRRRRIVVFLPWSVTLPRAGGFPLGNTRGIQSIKNGYFTISFGVGG